VTCLSPVTVWRSKGSPNPKTGLRAIVFNVKNGNTEDSLKIPCGHCLGCTLDRAKAWAIRCLHESKMHEQNAFITLTYDDENLPPGGKLVYEDFQKFIRALRKKNFNPRTGDREPLGYFVTGEYGERTKRPHWHAILFNWRPPQTLRRSGGQIVTDVAFKYSTERGDRVYTSQTLSETWNKGLAEFGDVTFHSAGYCARYAAKKLVHGDDGHEYEPISKKSSKHAIGKKFLEKYWKDVFTHGYIILEDGSQTGVPRYYEKWLKEHRPDDWSYYVTQIKPKKIAAASAAEEKEKAAWKAALDLRQWQSAERIRDFYLPHPWVARTYRILCPPRVRRRGRSFGGI